MKNFGKWMVLFLLTLSLALGCLGCTQEAKEETLSLNGQEIPLDAMTVDLSGKPLPPAAELEQLKALPALKKVDLRGTEMTPEQYVQLQQWLPQCEILWEIPLDGNRYAPDSRELTLTALTEETLGLLQYFSALETLELTQCPEKAMLEAARKLLPECRLHYCVDLAGEAVSSDATSLTAKNADPGELLEKLPLLPALTEVRLEGNVPDREGLLSLAEAFPELLFLCEVEVLGRKLSTDARELDFSGTPLTGVEEIEAVLPLFPRLEKVLMCDCGISSEEMDALWKRNPEVRFVWTVQVGMMKLRTDMTALMPYQHGYNTGAVLRTSECGEMKYLVDLVCIDFGHMQVTDLSFVSYMPDLEYLLVCGNGIRDISPLAGLKKLKYVELFANNIRDISPLAQCPALEDVNLCYNRIADVSPLLELENLKNLWASAIHLPEDQVELLETELGGKINLQLYQSRSTGGGWRELPNYYAQRDLLGMPYFTTP